MKRERKQSVDKNLISVAFVPYWGSGNPYQDTLAKSLESHGVKVDKGDLKSVVRNVMFRHQRLNILHLHWLPSFYGSTGSLLRLLLFVLRLSALRILGVKLVWTVHNLKPHESKYSKVDWSLSRILTTLAQAIIVHGETAKSKVISTFHLKNHEKIFVIPHGSFINLYDNSIDRTTARGKLGISNSRLVMLFFGGIRPYKGVLELIDAFKRLSKDVTEVELLIAGWVLNDEFSDAIKARIGTTNIIQYKPGFVSEDEIQVYMNACDVVVFPYREILTSGAVILAMSFGRACIAPRLGCIQDVLDDNGAFIYEPMNNSGLLNSLEAACANRENFQRMGRHNQRKAEQWNWDYIGIETKKVYLKDG